MYIPLLVKLSVCCIKVCLGAVIIIRWLLSSMHRQCDRLSASTRKKKQLKTNLRQPLVSIFDQNISNCLVHGIIDSNIYFSSLSLSLLSLPLTLVLILLVNQHIVQRSHQRRLDRDRYYKARFFFNVVLIVRH